MRTRIRTEHLEGRDRVPFGDEKAVDVPSGLGVGRGAGVSLSHEMGESPVRFRSIRKLS